MLHVQQNFICLIQKENPPLGSRS